MKLSKFKSYKIIIVVMLALIVSISVSAGNYVVPLIVFIASAALVFALKAKVNEVTVDERDLKLGGLAGRATYSVSSVAMALLAVVFMALSRKYPEYTLVGNLLAYISCAMILLYIGFYRYYQSKDTA
jgi:uncharacterized membrane protein